MTISADEREWAIQESRYKGMKSKNIPPDIIVEITGLTAEQLAAL